MKRILSLVLGLVLALPLTAQEPYSKEEFLRRYNNLAERVGPDGVGVETLLDRWEAAWPDDTNQMLARFSFCFARCRTSRVISLPQDRYLGNPPLVPMTDSLGNKVNYFEDYVFDDDLFAAANAAIGKAIAARQSRLDWHFAQIDALLSYEKEKPDMTLMELKSLADFHYSRKPDWEHPDLGTVSEEQFRALMQDYCVALFRIGSESSMEAFRILSEHLLKYCKGESMYLDNLGSYYLVKKDSKKARKYFDQVLKSHPGDMTALKNCILMARSLKDVKMEKKYLALLAAHGATEADRKGAQARLDAYNKK